ncbi:MAG: polysaccharide biosynthesis protein, partial [Anaerolineales bacterium]|nr:polysaccharide biosynthesis protein [Anaerolineales bacterium]
MMWKAIRNRHFLLLDVVFLLLAVYASFVLRLERFHIDDFWSGAVLFGGAVLMTTLFTFRQMGVYARYWQYASVDEMLLLVGAVTLATLQAGASSFLLLLFLPGNWVLPRSIPLIFLLLALAVTAGPRLAVRTLALYERRGRAMLPMKRVLIVGAGDAGEMMAREMLKRVNVGMLPVGFVDDDTHKHGVRIHGVPVLGDRYEIPRLVAQEEVQQVVIAMPAAPGKTIREIVSICERARVETKIMPGIYELLGGQVSVNQLRNVDIEDLLRREAIETDVTAVHALISGKRVLVTGGGGSIGSELCRQVLRGRPAELVFVGHGENSIFAMEHELARLRPDETIKITPVIADVRFAERMERIFRQYRPDIVFHAAAHKHVP